MVPSPAAIPPPAGRLDWYRQRLTDTGSVTIDAAVVALGVSGMTARRDLDTLEALGEARRVRGGALAVGPSPFRTRSPLNARAKVTIAEKLLPMVPTSGAIAIDSSSTMACLANVLVAARDLLVVTNGLETFESLQSRPGIRPVLTGGDRDERTSSLVGPVAEATARSFRYDVVFLSVAALDTGLGGLEVTPEEASLDRVFVAAAERVVLGADTSKVDVVAGAPVLAVEWSDVDVLVTELAPDSQRVRALTELTKVV